MWRGVFLALLRALIVFTVVVPIACFGATWTWNDDDTLSAVTTPSGAELSYHYATTGTQRLLSEVRLDGATVAQILRRDANLRADRVQFGGGRQLHLPSPGRGVDTRRYLGDKGRKDGGRS